MEKYKKYNPDEDTIEARLKGFEIWLLCNNITAADRKRNWCRALEGKAGNSVIEKLPQAAIWAEIKAELCSVLGDGEPKKRAFEISSRYKPKSKGLGEMATDIMTKAAIATNDVDLQTQLGLKAFLQAVPRSIGRDLRWRHFESVREALEEARFLLSVEEDEDCDNGKVFTVEAEIKSVEEPKVDLNQVVEACMKQLQSWVPFAYYCPLIPLYFSVLLPRHSGIRNPTSWTFPSESFLPFSLVQEWIVACRARAGT